MRSKVPAVLIAFAAFAAYGAAPVLVFNGDAAGEGFNDPTAATPVGGNPGVTIGQQRQIAFQYAANVWGQTLTSAQIIRVIAFFDDLPCTENSAALGAAAPFNHYANFPPASGASGLTPNTWYPAALAEKRTNVDIGALLPPGFNFELFAFFNSRLGAPGCLTGGGWYYGVDTNTPPGLNNLVAVLLHELGHGLGFTVNPTDTVTGVRPLSYASVWELHMKDLTTGKSWLNMTDEERAASAVNTNNLVWTGPQTTVDSLQVLQNRPELVLKGPGHIRGEYEAQAAAFGPPITMAGLSDILMPAYDTGGPSLTDGCEPFTTQPQKSVKGRIALVDRGICTFTQKVRNAQAAGAVGVVIANNVPSGLPSMTGVDQLVAIPSLGITQSLGQALRSLPNLSDPGSGGLPAAMRLSPTIRSGTTGGYVRLYAPAPLEQGSSVSHYDTTAIPNLLMEPFINRDLTHSVTTPFDLTFSLLRDIGW